MIAIWIGLWTAAHAACTALVGVTVHAPDGPHAGWDVAWDGARILAVGPQAAPAGCAVLSGEGWQVTAGFVALDTAVGLNEVDLEDRTHDDAVEDSDEIRASFAVADAFNPRSVVVPVTRLGGVTTVGISPSGGFLSGLGAAARLDGGRQADSLLASATGLHVHLDALGSTAAGLSRLRGLLEEARWLQKQGDRFVAADALTASRLDLAVLAQVAAGATPLFVHVDRASDIEALLRFLAAEKARAVVFGGAEAWLVADLLAAADVPVVLDPTVYGAGSFQEVLGRPDNAALLRAAGVRVALVGPESHNTRALRFYAGNAVREGMTHRDALAAITSEPARILGLYDRGRIAPGAVADLAVWSGDPLDTPARLLHLFLGGVSVPRVSRQTELVEAWRTLP
jgi:imidazolonepropionase-like amidohydrolase